MLLAAADWMNRFRPFTTFHLVVVLLCGLAIVGACWLGTRWRGTPAEERLRVWWAWSIVVSQGAALVWWFWPSHFDPAEDLPLQLCRIMAWVSAIAMFTTLPPFRALLYFWGLGLCFQGFVTPLRLDGLSHPYFWIFWIGHLQIVGSALYDLIVRGYRPTKWDYRFTLVAGLVFFLVISAINLGFGWNYAYLGTGKYRTRNVIDLLGPWPQRAILLFLLASATVTVLWIPWRLLQIRSRTRPELDHPQELTATQPV
jgi:hypothetical integral membrane protein (TIGR02206 family)